MTKFGDFSLLEDLGRSPVADRYKANHATQGGPFFLKVYSRLEPGLHAELLARCDSLIGRTHPNLVRHLGHGIVDGLPFVVSPYLEGIDLAELSTSLLDRRVNIGLESVLMVLGDLAAAVGALHAAVPGTNGHANGHANGEANGHTSAPFMAHGDVSIGHVRLGPDGQTWLTGITTPRGDLPNGPPRAPEGRWDIAGVGALAYDLVPLLRGGSARPPLPAPLDRVVRRALGIGTDDDRIQPEELIDRLGEVGNALKLKPDRSVFAELVRRTVRAVEKRSAESGRVAKVTPGAKPRTPADAIPSLDPVDRLPTLEPVGGQRRPPSPPRGVPARPAPIEIELVPVGDRAHGGVEAEATTELVARSPAPTAPIRPALEPRALEPHAVEPRASVTPPASPPSQWTHTSTRPLDVRATTEPRGVPAPTIVEALPQTRTLETRPPDFLPPEMLRPVEPLPAERPAERPAEARPVEHMPAAEPSPDDDPFAATPHTDPRALLLPPDLEELGATPTPALGVPAPDFTAFDTVPGALPSAVPSALPQPVARPPAKPSTTPPPLTPRTRPATAAHRPLLADPPEGNSALHEQTRDATDPDQKSARTDTARREPAVMALLARKLVSDQALSSALEEHALRGGRVVEILVAAGVLTDGAVADALAAESGRARVSDDALKTRLPPQALVRRLPQTYVLARRVLPLALEYGALSVAIADPFDHATLDELKNLLAAQTVEAVVGSRAAITAATVEAYRNLGIGGVPGTQGASHTVLLCTTDDAKAARIGARLAQEGMRVELVVDGDAAREILATRPPTVVICAHDLPHAAGSASTGPSIAALLLFAREQPSTADLPFFVYGPRGDEALATKILDLGADDYFTEPLKLEVLLAKVRRAVGKGRSSAEGLPLNDPSGAFRTAPPMSSEGPPPFLDERTPVTAIPLVAPGQHTKRTEPSFIENIAMPSLADLPELPADFADEQPQMAPAMPTGVMGTLRQMALAEIVQSLEMGRKTARVDLVPAEGEKGMIAFETGQIRYAECGALRGEDAFYQLARHTEGFFRIHYGDKPPETNITHQTTYLLLEAMRRMDEEGQDLGGSDGT